MWYRSFSVLLGTLFFAACSPNLSSLSGKKKSNESEKASSHAALSVRALKKESGILLCSGVTSDLKNLVRTRATFVGGKLESLFVSAYTNKDNPKDIPNELSPDLKKHELFFHELKDKLVDMDLDLDGNKFEIEGFAVMNEKARKIYDLEVRVEDDGEGDKTLNAYLSYKDASISLDLSEVFVGCAVVPKN